MLDRCHTDLAADLAGLLDPGVGLPEVLAEVHHADLVAELGITPEVPRNLRRRRSAGRRSGRRPSPAGGGAGPADRQR